MKKIFLFILSIISISCFAETNGAALYANISNTTCTSSTRPTDTEFCTEFKADTICRCKENRLGKVCTDDNVIDQMYNIMIGMYTTVDNACAHQRDVPKQVCIDDWNCYRNGGYDSQGNICGGTDKDPATNACH